MIYINLLTNLKQKLFEKQLPECLSEKGIIYKINSREDIVWDLVVVYDDFCEPISLRHKDNGLLFISGEPPMVLAYSESFLNQFDYIISAHPEIKHRNNFIGQQSLPFYFGYGFDDDSIDIMFNDLTKEDIPEKSKKISFITSNRNFLPGHIERVKFLDTLQKQYSEYIDFYGKGFYPINDKADAILPYYFTICVENSNINDYWTEKISDTFLGYSVPVYYGCKNIYSYFSPNSYVPIDIRDTKSTFSSIENLIQNTESIYDEKLPYLIESRDKCLYEYNAFYSIISFARQHIWKEHYTKIVNTTLQPSIMFHDNDYKNKCIKAKRILSKRIYRIFRINI